jgi:EF-P beta-lysylation protein EpmB
MVEKSALFYPQPGTGGHPPAPGAAPAAWEREWAGGFARVGELLEWLGLDAQALGVCALAEQAFPFRITRSWAARIRPGDPADPLLRQVLPLATERVASPGFGSDPVGDLASQRAPGLLQKYAGRALLVTTGSCAIHCRYCFRRGFPYATQRIGRRELDQTLAAIAADPGLHEVILSGGDPLALPDGHLDDLLARLAMIPQLRRIRIHTRLPVVLPARVGDGLLQLLARPPQPVIMVVHSNHAQELDGEVAAALGRLRAAGITLLNQTVLLRDVNDDAGTLAALSERLFACGVLPYYLHQLDRVQGAAHFEVSDERARELMRGLSAQLPGYLVPRLVREVAGEPAKRLLPFM